MIEQEVLSNSTNVLFILLGAVLILAMHAGFAFLEVGSVRKKNQVNALNKILTDYSISALVYFFIGYPLARGVSFFKPAEVLAMHNGLELVRFFLFLGFAACVPAIISGGIAERSKFWTNSLANMLFIALIYPIIEGVAWGQFSTHFASLNGSFATSFGAPFHDFAGSVVVHATGGWLALPVIIYLGPRIKRYESDVVRISSIPFLALGSWILIVGWFGFNVMSAGAINNISGLVAVNSILAMTGGCLSALFFSKNDAGFVHNGALAGLVAVCAGSDIFHPIGALIVGVIAGTIFVVLYHLETEKFKIDDVLGVWPLHGVCGAWGGIAVGIFGSKILGGIGNVAFISQVVGTIIIVSFCLLSSYLIYGVLKSLFGIRFKPHDEIRGSDLAIHGIEANPEEAL